MHPESSAKMYRVLFQPNCYAQALGLTQRPPRQAFQICVIGEICGF
jgi:hypothetical protein